MAWVPLSPFGEPGWAARPGQPGRTLPKSHTPGAFVFPAGGPPDQGQEPQANVSNSRSALSPLHSAFRRGVGDHHPGRYLLLPGVCCPSRVLYPYP